MVSQANSFTKGKRKMFAKQIVTKDWEIVRTSEQHTVFTANGKTFVVAVADDGFNVYRAVSAGSDDLQLLPGCKFGKTFRTVSNFVAQRS